ncbi:MAG TPA: hypothetical protein VGU02_06975 [Gaiellaceae bacterium]|nr:hypothetical protein [Gaiellaceae bacterium]
MLRLAILFGSLPAGEVAAVLVGSQWVLVAVVLGALAWVLALRFKESR